MRGLGVSVAAAALAVLSACTTGGAMQSPSEPASARPPFGTMPPLPAPTGGTATSLAPARWQAILDDLARRGIPVDAVSVTSTESITWNDGSLGCPEPGVMYTQAIVRGLRVMVSAAGRPFDYRFGTGDTPRLCTPKPRPSGSSTR